jgi:hypothetical protein
MLGQVHGIGSLVTEKVLWVAPRSTAASKRSTSSRELWSKGDHTDGILQPNPDRSRDRRRIRSQAGGSFAGRSRCHPAKPQVRQAGSTAQVSSHYQQAKIEADRGKQLADQGLIPRLDFKLSLAWARYSSFNVDDPDCRANVDGGRALVAPPDREIAHFPLDSALIAPVATGGDALIEYFLQHRLMELFLVLRGE